MSLNSSSCCLCQPRGSKSHGDTITIPARPDCFPFERIFNFSLIYSQLVRTLSLAQISCLWIIEWIEGTHIPPPGLCLVLRVTKHTWWDRDPWTFFMPFGEARKGRKCLTQAWVSGQTSFKCCDPDKENVRWDNMKVLSLPNLQTPGVRGFSRGCRKTQPEISSVNSVKCNS